MKRALLAAPLFAAALFTVAESWMLMRSPETSYVPVIFELLLFLFGYLAAALVNALVVVPLCLALQRAWSSLAAGLLMALGVALFGTTVAYAWEIFGYRSSILEPEYFYPLFIPLFMASLASFYFLRARDLAAAPRQSPEPEEE